MGLIRRLVREPLLPSLDPGMRQVALMLAALRRAGSVTPSMAVLDGFYREGLPLLLGHRGAMARAPENTLGAFAAAIDDGARGIELDTQLSGDSVPIVLHDDTLDRTSNGRGRPTLFDADELAGLDAGTWFPGWSRVEKVPRLHEVLAAMPDGAVVNVELKGPTPTYQGLEARVVDVIRQHDRRVRVIVSSFHPAQLLAMRDLAPDVPLGMLIADDSLLPLRTAWAAPLLLPDAIHPPARIVNVGFMEAARRANLRVHVWAVRDAHDAARLLDLGVDGLIVDDVADIAAVFTVRYGSSR